MQGTWEGAAFHAERITVYGFCRPGDVACLCQRGDARVCGELMDRDETTLKVRTSDAGGLTVVHINAEMPVAIPGKEGLGTVNDLLYHLDVEKMSKSKKNVVAPDALVASTEPTPCAPT